MSAHLVREHVSRDLVETLEQLAAEAKKGIIVGAIFGVSLRGRGYHVNVSGTLARDPTFARGVCAAIDDELRSMVQCRAASETTL